MSNMDRSLAFSALLEWPEFAKLETRMGERVTTELVKIYRDNPAHNMWDTYVAYRATIGEGNLAAHAAALEVR